MRVFLSLPFLLLLSAPGVLCRPASAAATFSHNTKTDIRVEYATDDPYPTGELRTARPTIAWRIVPQGGVRVTSVALTLNKRRITDAAYLPERGAVSYTPTEPLAPGRYAVHCTVTLDRDFVVEKDWVFRVSSAAATAGLNTASVTLTSSPQQSVFAEVNALRRRVSLPGATPDSRLCAAALGHSAYLARNGAIGHTQAASLPGFVGETTRARLAAYGYPGDGSEDVARAATPVAAVRRLFDAPYHRTAFLQPGALEIGTGSAGEVTTLLFAAPNLAEVAPSIVTYPAKNQKNVPLTWDGIETPNPLRLHRRPLAPVLLKQPLLGYPITLNIFGGAGTEVTLRNVRASLSEAGSGRAVPVYVNSPDNDSELRSGIIVIPARPLLPQTTYRVHINASDARGVFFARSWTFTTAGNAFQPSRTR